MKKLLAIMTIALITLGACTSGGDKSFDNADTTTIAPADTSTMQSQPQQNMPVDSVSSTSPSGNR